MARFMFPYKVTITYSTVMWALLMFLILLQHHMSDGKPYDKILPKQMNLPTDCDKNAQIETQCQRCAKETKSIVVYPMCCTNEEDARSWCIRYLDFGLQR